MAAAAAAAVAQQWGALSDTNYSWYLSIQPQDYNRQMGPKHLSNDDVLEAGLSNNGRARVFCGDGGGDICMLAGAEGPVAPPPRPPTPASTPALCAAY